MSQNYIILTQAHPDKNVDRYRRFALGKLSKSYPVYLAGALDHAFATSESKSVFLAPFLYRHITQSLDWPRLQDWVQQENIDGVWFFDYEDVITTPPEFIPQATPGAVLLIQSPSHRERQDHIGTHQLYGPLFLGAEIIAQIDFENLPLDYWMRLRLLLAAMQHGLRPEAFFQDYNLLISLDRLPFGLLDYHLEQTRSIIDRAMKLPAAAEIFGDDWAALKDFSARCALLSDKDRAKELGVPELFKQIVLPTTRILRSLFGPAPSVTKRHEPKPIPLENIKSIGIIKLDNIGDGLLMTPMLRQLRARFKGEIRMLCSYQQYDFWKNCPEIDRLTTIEKKHISDSYIGYLSMREYQRNRTEWITEYAAAFAEKAVPFFEGCEAILLPRGGSDYYNGLNTACLTSAPYRVMNFHPTGRESKWTNGFDQNMTHPVLRTMEHPHDADSMIDLLTAFGLPVELRPRRLDFWTTREDQAIVRNLYKPDPVKKQIIMATGASCKNKTWPIEFFIEFMQLLARHLDYELVLIGADAERPLNDAMIQNTRMRVHDFTSLLTIPQAIHLMTQCHLLIGGNSAPLHMATAADIPIVEVQLHPKTAHPDHVSSPLRFGNISQKSIMLRPEVMAGPPCVEACYSSEAHCIKGVTPQMALEAALSLLKIV